MELEDDISRNLNRIEELTEQINTANSELDLDVIADVEILLKEILQSEIENVTIEQTLPTFELISKNLENIYYNTRGAVVFRNKRDLHALTEHLKN